MLLKSVVPFKFETPYQKVLDACIALDNTLIFSGIKVHRKFCLTHCSKDKVIAEHLFDDDGVDSWVMVSDRDLYGLIPSANTVIYWNLETHERIDIPFNFTVPDTYCSEIFAFPENNMICIMQNGATGNNTFRLTYFNLPFTKESEPVDIFTDDDHHWTNDHTIITRGNNKSMVCWLKTRFNESFDFCTYDLENKLKHYQIPNAVGEPYGEKNIELNTAQMWEMRPDEFCFICHSNRTKPEEWINNNYIVDVKNQTVREAHFKFQTKIEHELHIDQLNFGSTAMIRTIAFEKGEALPTPVYYIDNQSQKIIAVDSWKCSHLHKYHLPGFDGNLLVEGLYDNGDVKELTLEIKKIMDGKEISVYLLSETIEDVDEDLLYDVTQMIDYGN